MFQTCASRIPLIVLALACIAGLQARDRMILAEDDASNTAYKSGWSSASAGLGFRDWTLRTLKEQTRDSNAGFYIAEKAGNHDLNGVAIRGKAFAMYANGHGFEAAAAFRLLKKPLAVGQTFSFLLEHGAFEKKSAHDDPAKGAIGITLRSGNASENAADYNKGARFEFGCYEGSATYRIFDGGTEHDTGVALSNGGLSISLTLVTADTYDLEITKLADMKTTTLPGRKLGGTAGGKIESFCVFDRDGEKSDAYFNGFQITGEIE